MRASLTAHAQSLNAGSQYSSVLSTGPTARLAVCNSRACNALSFSTAASTTLVNGTAETLVIQLCSLSSTTSRCVDSGTEKASGVFDTG
ncbi:hypothetical protein M378DRAFT_739984 [Amanita muscaria Koide BX008]|uniref:Uncharacterized protein n=1 Tax=Amanita muscaria (strain Koide BX008) TaxID=946122 RepID=A0A0C2X2K2_AMAMK|nr:hypothetical protein M378DRAFT_739984 [Amanita muscaria Koide BX008]